MRSIRRIKEIVPTLNIPHVIPPSDQLLLASELVHYMDNEITRAGIIRIANLSFSTKSRHVSSLACDLCAHMKKRSGIYA